MDTMINGLYGYFFGATDESSADTANQENRDVQKPSTKAEEAEWILVDEGRSGRSSPVFVPDAELDELDSVISTAASNISLAETKKQLTKLEKEEKKKAARAALQQRQWLEMKMFETEPIAPSGLDSVGNTPPSPPAPVAKLTAAKLKRAGQALQNEPKAKTRSKKNSAKLSAGRSNDRKCNNIN